MFRQSVQIDEIVDDDRKRKRGMVRLEQENGNKHKYCKRILRHSLYTNRTLD